MVADLLDGRPLFTPSLMGSVMFLGMAAEDVEKVRLDAVAYCSIVTFIACLADRSASGAAVA